MSSPDVLALLSEHADAADLRLWAVGYQAKDRLAESTRAKTRAAEAIAELADRLPNDPAEIAAAILSAPRAPLGRSAADLMAQAPEQPDWLIPGWLGRTWAVKIAAREKVGNGKFVMTMLGHLERGEPTIFGPAAEPTTALVLTEEPQDSIREKIADAGLLKATIVYGYELADCPTWAEKAQRIVDAAVQHSHGLVFADNISRAAGVEDEAGVELARRAEELFTAAKAAGLAVIVDHHHRKAAGKTEDKSRGGTALAGATDCNIELEVVGSAFESRVRRLSSRGRVSATIWTRTIALADDGRSYESVADDEQPQRTEDRHRLRALREAGEAGVTVAAYACAIDRTDDTARATLREFVGRGWSTESDGRPAVFVITEEGEEAARTGREQQAYGGLEI